MLHAIYKTSPYIFYLSTEDNRIDTSKTDTDNLKYLFKLTNDMSGVIYYAFAQNQVVYNRYTKLELTHSLTPSYYLGEVNLVPNGYWNYELFEYSGNITAETTCATVPDPTLPDYPEVVVYGYVKITLTGGAVYSTFKLTPNEIDFQLTNLDEVLYQFDVYDNCDVKLSGIGVGYTIRAITAQANGERWLEITDYTTTVGGCTVKVKSKAPVGYSYEFATDESGPYVFYQTTNITSDPQETIHNFTYAVNQTVFEVRMYDALGGNAGGGSLAYPTTDSPTIGVRNSNNEKYGIATLGATNPVSVDAGGTVLDKGSLWTTTRYGTIYNSSAPNYYTFQGLITQGKLYVEEPLGEEQVQYTEYTAPTSTNTIYYEQ
tara:strand:+ start:957 stop:2078 length:1122 start_codon:yes stop_codon:yes gene_type:complete